MKRLSSSLLCLALVQACADEASILSQATIAGQVLLTDVDGLNDLSRVRIDVGQGAGGVPPAEDGTFLFSGLDAKIYNLRISYDGSFSPTAENSAYQPVSLRVVAEVGGSTNLGEIALPLGVGTVTGPVELLEGTEVRLLSDDSVRQTHVNGGVFRFEDVPVGHYSLTVRRIGFSRNDCAARVTVSYHTEEATPESVLTGVQILPDPAQVHEVVEDTWYLTGDQVTILPDAPAAEDLRCWTAAEQPGSYQGDATSCTLSDIPLGATDAFVQLRDLCGFEGEPFRIELIRDESPPLIEALRLNGGEPFTAETTTTLAIQALDGLSDQIFVKQIVCDVPASGTATCAPATLDAAIWSPLVPIQSIGYVSNEEGTKEVQLKLRDRSFNETEVQRVSVFYDATLPIFGLTIGDGSGTIYRSDPWVELTSDNTAAEMRLGTDAGLLGRFWEPYRQTFRFPFNPTEGQKTLYAQVRDLAGNDSQIISAQVELNLRGILRGELIRPSALDGTTYTVSLVGTNYSVTSTLPEWVVPAVPQGSYDLRLFSTGYRTLVLLSVDVFAGQVRDIGTHYLEPAVGYITGRVRKVGHSYHGGIYVELEGVPTATATSFSNGSFTLVVPPDTYVEDVVATLDRFNEARYTDPIRVILDETHHIGELDLIQRENYFEGRALREGASDHSGLLVESFSETSTASTSTLTNAFGEYKTANQPLGQYRLRFSDPSGVVLEKRMLHRELIPGDPVYVQDVGLQDIVLRNLFVTINDHAAGTNDENVTLNIGVPGCHEMKISNLADLSDASFQPCSHPVSGEPGRFDPPWTLAAPSIDGTKTVYAVFRTSSAPMTDTATISDEIVLDTVSTITSFTHDATGPLGLGDRIHFRMDAELNGSVAKVGVSGWPEILLNDDGLDGDPVAGDARYEVDYLITEPVDVNSSVEGYFWDWVGNYTDTTAPAITVIVPPLIFDVQVQVNLTAQEVEITWSTDERTTGRVDWGTDTSYGNTETTPDGISHSATLSGLTPSQDYHFQITAEDGAGNTSSTPDRVVRLVPNMPTWVAVIGGNNRVHVRWESDALDGLQGFHIYRRVPAGAAQRLTIAPYDHPALIFEDDTVGGSTNFEYAVTAVDDSGNESSKVWHAAIFPTTPCNANVQGTLYGVHVWSERCSPYTLTGGITVASGGLLVIGPGTEVRVQLPVPPDDPHDIEVEAGARLALLGYESDEVVLTSASTTPQPGDWDGILFWGDTDDNGVLDLYNGRYRSGQLLHRAQLSYAHIGILTTHTGYPNHVVGVGLAVLRSRIHHNEQGIDMRDPEDHAIIVSSTVADNVAPSATVHSGHQAAGVTFDGTDLLVLDSVFARNHGIAHNMAGGLVAKGGGARIEGTSFLDNQGNKPAVVGLGGGELVCNCSFLRNQNGIGPAALHLGTNTAVVGSTIADNVGGSGAIGGGQSGSWLNVDANRFENNLSTNDVGAHHATHAAYIRGNVFIATATSASAPAVTYSGELAYNHFVGVFQHTAVLLNSLSSNPMSMNANSFLMDPAPGIFLAEVFDGIPRHEVLDATGNYWGPMTTNEILTGPNPQDLTALLDEHDDNDLAEIDYDGNQPVTNAFPLVRISGLRYLARVDHTETVFFKGHAIDPEDGPLPATSLSWYDSTTGNPLGTGAELHWHTPPVGIQEVELRAVDSGGNIGKIWWKIEVQ